MGYVQFNNIQRIYADKNVKALKLGWAIGCVAPWALNLSGIFIGTMGVYILAGQDVDPNESFATIVATFMVRLLLSLSCSRARI
jgi:hypothetical protein